jgi:hypothetical protein
MARPSPPTAVNAAPTEEDPGKLQVSWAPPKPPAGAWFEVTALPTLTLYRAEAAPMVVAGLERGVRHAFEVRTVNQDGKSEPGVSGWTVAERREVSRNWIRTSSAAVGLAAAATLTLLVLGFGKVGDRATLLSLGFACGFISVAALVLAVTGRPFGVWRMLIGRDQRVSTSAFQTTLWTWLVAFVLAYFTARSWFFGEPGLFLGLGPGGTASSVWDDYLALLGGPFAALILARGIVADKAQTKTIQKTTAEAGTASLGQAVTDDDGNLDLVDGQYLIFNLAAFAYVVAGLASTNRLPTIPGLLLALTGSAAATYVANKAMQRNAPAVTAVTPSSFRPGERILVEGENFLPVGSHAAPTVTVGGRQAVVEEDVSDSRITAIAPADVQPGSQQLVVRSAAKVSTKPKTVQVLADTPVMTGVSPDGARSGTEVFSNGSGFLPWLRPRPRGAR